MPTPNFYVAHTAYYYVVVQVGGLLVSFPPELLNASIMWGASIIVALFIAAQAIGMAVYTKDYHKMVDRPASIQAILDIPLVIGQATFSLITGKKAEYVGSPDVLEGSVKSFGESTGVVTGGVRSGKKARRRSSLMTHTVGLDAGTSNQPGTERPSFKLKRAVSFDASEVGMNTYLQRASTTYGGSFSPKTVENVYQVTRMIPQFLALTLAMAAYQLAPSLSVSMALQMNGSQYLQANTFQSFFDGKHE